MIVYLYLCRAHCQPILPLSTPSLTDSASPHPGLTVMPHLWAGPPGVRQLITANSSPPRQKKYRKIQVSPKSSKVVKTKTLRAIQEEIFAIASGMAHHNSPPETDQLLLRLIPSLKHPSH